MVRPPGDETMATASELNSVSLHLISSYLIAHSQPARGAVTCRPARSLNHGDVYLPSRDVATAVRRIVEREGLKLEDLLRDAEASSKRYFQSVSITPQGLLSLSFNRTLVFMKCLQEVMHLGDRYGRRETSGATVLLNLINTPSLTQGWCRSESGRPGTTDLPQARAILLVGLLAKLLQNAGYTVECANPLPMESELSPLMLHLLHSTGAGPSATTTPAGWTSVLSEAEFLAAVAKSPYTLETVQDHFAATPCGGRREVCGLAAAESELASGKALTIDAKRFLHDKALSGKGGFSHNICQVAVTDESGRLTVVGKVAYEMCKLGLRYPGCGSSNSLVNVTQQRLNFVAQQAMVVFEILQNESTATPSQNVYAQHLLQVSGVECSTSGQSVKQCSLDELMVARLEQMTEAHTIKYGTQGAQGSQLQSIAQRITEAVVKFQLLSTDPNSTVRLELPSAGSGAEPDIRFSGAFVLYNYARLASLFSRYGRACERGAYPPLPDVEEVDFSLLREQEEWQLLFQYVLQYPSVLGEAAELKGAGIQVGVGVKKICQFLTKLSHTFSSYYSRVKVLVAPEPHLVGVVHARLYLMSAIKQVMYSALSLLSIRPLEEI